ncbi:MAG: ComEA family DNA-binding protein [Anaerosomatales bacterium]|nr:ComEA family DNA-binding protein [Anaerosomatales bacterium]
MERTALDAVVEAMRRLGLTGVTRRHVLIGAAAIAVGAVVAFAALSSGAPDEVAVFGGGEDAEFPQFDQAEEATGAAGVPLIVLHVAGAVRHPGVYELPDGARVHDAIEAAGGVLASAAPDALNLARIVADGERLYVPTADEVDAGMADGEPYGGGPGASTASGGAALVDINTADAATLEQLPGIGPATAAKIVDDREKNGPFKTVDDLARVSGIGAKKIEALRDSATAG